MSFKDLREFISLLEQEGELKRITAEVDPNLEITEIADRCLRNGGPALLFENPKGSSVPLLANLFGNTKRIALAMGQQDLEGLRDVGRLLAFLKEPSPPKGWRDLWQSLPSYKNVQHPVSINIFAVFRVLLENDENDVLLAGPGNVLQTHFLRGFDKFANGLLF